MDNQNETVNIFLKSQSDKERIFAGSSSHARYIILQNDTLHFENKEKTLKIIELQNKNDELENDNDRMSEGKRYTQGLLKNLVELEHMHNKISNINSNISNQIIITINSYKTKASKHLQIFYGLLFGIIGCIWEKELMNINEFCFLIFIVIFSLTFSINMFNALTIPSFISQKEEINELNKQIQEIKDSQDFISDHIDNL